MPRTCARRSHGRWPGLLILALITCLSVPRAGLARVSDICDRAAERVAAESGVPVSVLKAITRTETGRRRDGAVRPWPWTVNMEGAGHWFDSRDEALSFASRRFRQGARSFDVGCFQINFKWHGQAFASIDEMFDPMANGRYAADFLNRLHDELGDWNKAAGAFHSRTEKYARKYRKTFEGYRAAYLEEDGRAPAASRAPSRGQARSGGLTRPGTPRVNAFPLLTGAGSTGGMGSLVPLGAAPRPLFGQEG